MKIFTNILKILTALAAVAGAVYIIATYGDKIVAWAKKLLNCTCCCDAEAECVCEGDCACDGECGCQCDCTCEEEPQVCCCQEAPAEEPAVEEAAVVAEEADFEA